MKRRFPRKKKKRYIYGHQAVVQQKELGLKLEYPIRRGLVKNLEQAEALWNRCFKNFDMKPQESNVLLGLRPLTPKVEKQKIAQLLFESIGLSGAYVSDHCLLAMYSLGRMNGVVMDIGHETTFSTAILDGQSFLPSTIRCDIGGSHITRYLAHMLRGKGENGSETEMTAQTTYAYEQIVANHCFVADSLNAEAKKASVYDASRDSRKKRFRLPDGKELPVGGSVELCQAPEALFNPSLLSCLKSTSGSPIETNDGHGISQLLQLTIEKCGHSIRPSLYKSMLVCGGPTMLPGMQRRLQKEMLAVLPHSVSKSSSNYRLHLPPHRKHSSYLGGSILASLPMFNTIKMKRSEYAECGPSLVDRKCC
mmetsp:Transcript_11712/g.28857  ORF Transcript_11712/g.28857 Transcript_11712/m.28857 type:complete len:365 (-) Transcript_11712:340-1434(-)